MEHEQKAEEAGFKCWVKSLEGLRVRRSPNLDSDVITVFEHKKEIDVYEIGAAESIDGKLGFWLRVKTYFGEGLIFGAYTSIVPETIATDKENDLELNTENLAGT